MVAYFLSSFASVTTPPLLSVPSLSLVSIVLSWSTLIIFPEGSPQCGSLTIWKVPGAEFLHTISPSSFKALGSGESKTSASASRSSLSSPCCFPVNNLVGYFTGLLFPVASLFLLPRCCVCVLWLMVW